jgi:hypothetical protein
MKTARFLFTIIAFGALTLGLSHAGEPAPQPTEQVLRQNHPIGTPPQGAVKPRPPMEQVLHENHSTRDRSADPAHGNQARGKLDPTDKKHSSPKDDSHAAKKIRQAVAVKTEPQRTPGHQVHQPGSKKPATAAKDRLQMNKTGKPRQQLAKSAVGNQALPPPPGRVRSRNATAALVGRVLITSNAKYSAGPLDGAAIKRKP